jgi:hypothetical protein
MSRPTEPGRRGERSLRLCSQQVRSKQNKGLGCLVRMPQGQFLDDVQRDLPARVGQANHHRGANGACAARSRPGARPACPLTSKSRTQQPSRELDQSTACLQDGIYPETGGVRSVQECQRSGLRQH